MTITEVELHNFCNHTNLVIRPGATVTGLVGPIGSGKSNVLRAIRGAFSGSFNQGDGVQATNISQFRDEDDDKCYVRIAGVHDRQKYELIRRISPDSAKDSLRLESEPKPILGARNVNAMLEKMFRTPLAAIDRYIFVRQGALGDFFSVSDLECTTTFAKILELDYLTKVRDKLSKPVSALSGRAEATELRNNLARLTTERDSILLSQGTLQEKLRKAVEEERLYAAWRKTSEGLLEVVSANRKNIADYNAQIVKMHASRAALDSTASRRAELAKKVLEEEDLQRLNARNLELASQLAVLDQAVGTRTSLGNRLQQHQSARAKLEEREKTLLASRSVLPAVTSVFELRQRVELMSQSDARYEVFLKAKQESAADVCGTCLQPLPPWVASFDETAALVNREALHTRQKILAEHDAAVAKLTADEQLWEAESAALNDAVEYTLTQLAALGSVDDDLRQRLRFEMEDASVRIEQHFNHVLEYRELVKQNAADLQAAATAQTEVDRLWELVQLNPDDAALAKVEEETRKNLAAISESSELKKELELELSELGGRLKATDQELAVLRNKEEEIKRIEAALEPLTLIRNMLHPMDLPLRVVRRFVSSLLSPTNLLLEDFEAGFTLMLEEGGEGISLFASFPDGRVQPAIRLSGGQQTLASLAFLVTINGRMAGSLGLLCLDEPTAFLPSYETTCLAAAIAKLRSLGSATGLQVFVSTHERALERLFDVSVRLGEPS